MSLRPGPNAALLMCRTKLDKVRLKSDFEAMTGSDGVLVLNLIREAGGNNFRRENMRSEYSRTLSK